MYDKAERERLEMQIRNKLLKVYQIEVEAIKEERDDYIQRLNDTLENGAAEGREMKKRLGQAIELIKELEKDKKKVRGRVKEVILVAVDKAVHKAKAEAATELLSATEALQKAAKANVLKVRGEVEVRLHVQNLCLVYRKEHPYSLHNWPVRLLPVQSKLSARSRVVPEPGYLKGGRPSKLGLGTVS